MVSFAFPSFKCKRGNSMHLRSRGPLRAFAVGILCLAAFFNADPAAAATWQEVRSTVPILELATDGHTYVAVAFNGLWSSTDLKSWTKVSLPAGAGVAFSDIIWDGSRFIAVGSGIISSSDGATWSVSVQASDSEKWSAITVGGGTYVVVGSDASHVERSTDGVHWTSVSTGLSAPSPYQYSLTGVASNGSGFVSLGSENQAGPGYTLIQKDIVATSPDGVTWTLGTLPPTSTGGVYDTLLQDVAWGAGKYVAGGRDGVYTSLDDGVTWSAVAMTTTFPTDFAVSLSFLNGNFVAVGVSNTGSGLEAAVFTSPDGATWSTHDIEPRQSSSYAVAAALFTGGQYVVGGEQGVYASTDAATWAKIYTDTQTFIGGCVLDSSSDHYVIPGNYGSLLSDGGSTWSADFSASNQVVGSLFGNGCGAYGAGVYVAVPSGSIFWSSDGSVWTLSSGPYSNIEGVAWNGSSFAAVDTNVSTLAATAYTSTDGKTWVAAGTIDNSGANIQFGTISTGGLASLNGNWVAWGTRNGAPFVAVSTDAIHWISSTSGLPSTGILSAVAYGGGVYTAIGSDLSGHTLLFTSADAKNWTSVALTSGTDASWQTMIYGDSEFLAGGMDNVTGSAAFLRSSNGADWAYNTDADTSEIDGISWDGSKYLVASLYDILSYTPPISSGSGGGSGGGGSGGKSGGGTLGIAILGLLGGLVGLRRRLRSQ